jgi:NodT family efflux transporter outer membrane factor (OMF) lipoprotein
MLEKNKKFLRVSAIIILISYLSGCIKVGPNFRSPCPPHTNGYTETPLPAKTVSTPKAGDAGKAQHFVCNVDIPAGWWYLFHSPEINCLVQMGLANSPTLAAAQAALQQAQENVNVQVGNTLLPAVDFEPYVQRQRQSEATFGNNILIEPTVFNLYNVSVGVSYSPDVFGGAQRQIESLEAQVDYQQFQLLAAYLSLTANIVTTAITTASLEEQIRATQKLIQIEQDQLDILQKQLNLGGIALTNVLTQQTLLNQTRATLPPLQKSLSQALHSLSVLVGASPDQPLPTIDLNKLVLPDCIPISLSSCLVRQRPDIRAAEAQVHYATAQIGVATANLLPQFNITASYGWLALSPPDLFHPDTLFWNIMVQAMQPIFHGGALRAARRASIAAYRQTVAQYAQTVLQAFQNVADSLRAIQMDARTLQADKAAEIAALGSLKLSQQQLNLGGVSYLNLLTAQQNYQQTLLARIQAQAARYADTAALYQALGGGWWNRNCCPDPVNPINESLKRIECHNRYEVHRSWTSNRYN